MEPANLIGDRADFPRLNLSTHAQHNNNKKQQKAKTHFPPVSVPSAEAAFNLWGFCYLVTGLCKCFYVTANERSAQLIWPCAVRHQLGCNWPLQIMLKIIATYHYLKTHRFSLPTRSITNASKLPDSVQSVISWWPDNNKFFSAEILKWDHQLFLAAKHWLWDFWSKKQTCFERHGTKLDIFVDIFHFDRHLIETISE